MIRRILALSAFAFLLASCNSSPAADTNPTSGGGDPAAQAVLRYLEAKAAADRDGVRAVLCSSMESQLDIEALSLSGLNARLEGASCTTDAGGATVTCTGVIVAEYGTETRELPLSQYNVVQEDGEWRWCGETTAP